MAPNSFIPRLLLVAGLLLTACNNYEKLAAEGDRAFRRGDYKAAAAAYQDAARDARQASTAQRLGVQAADVLALYLDEHESAAAEYQRAIRRAPTSKEALKARVKLGELLVRHLGDPRNGIEQYHLALANHAQADGRDELHMKIARAYFELGEYHQARVEFKHLITRFPDSSLVPEALYVTADSFYVEGQHEDARKFFEEVVEEYPKSQQAPLARFGLGRILEDQLKYDQALEVYREVRDHHPNPGVVDLRIQRVEERS